SSTRFLVLGGPVRSGPGRRGIGWRPGGVAPQTRRWSEGFGSAPARLWRTARPARQRHLHRPCGISALADSAADRYVRLSVGRPSQVVRASRRAEKLVLPTCGPPPLEFRLQPGLLSGQKSGCNLLRVAVSDQDSQTAQAEA